MRRRSADNRHMVPMYRTLKRWEPDIQHHRDSNDPTTAHQSIPCFPLSPSFLPRDAMCKRGLCYGPVSVRPSVRLSVAFVHSIKTAEDIVKLLCQPGSPIILVFWFPAPAPNSNSLQWGRKIEGGGNFFCDFRLKSTYISEMVQDRSMVTMER